jgi:hypothetical protein
MGAEDHDNRGQRENLTGAGTLVTSFGTINTNFVRVGSQKTGTSMGGTMTNTFIPTLGGTSLCCAWMKTENSSHVPGEKDKHPC